MATEILYPSLIVQIGNDNPNGNSVNPVNAIVTSIAPFKKVLLKYSKPVHNHHRMFTAPASINVQFSNELYDIDFYTTNVEVTENSTFQNIRSLYSCGNKAKNRYFYYNTGGSTSRVEYSTNDSFTMHADALKKGIIISGRTARSYYRYNNGSTAGYVEYEVTENKLSNFGLTVTFADAPEAPVIQGLTCVSGFVNRLDESLFKWNIIEDTKIYDQFKQTSAIFYFKKKTEVEWMTRSISGDVNEIVIQANTFEKGEYQWKVKVTVDDGQIAESPEYTFTTIDSIPEMIGISPVNEVITGIANFLWIYNNETGTKQKAVDIQVSNDEDSWTDVLNYFPTDKLNYSFKIAAGEWYWRIRGYNQDDVAGSWSPSYKFICNAPPDPPQITGVQSGGRPSFNWSSSGQIAYEYKLTGEDYQLNSGIIYSQDKNCLINDYIKNGIYEFRLRIFNVYGHASEWTVISYSQSITLPEIIVNASQTDEGILLTWSSDESYPNYYILRNGNPIAKVNERRYLDLYCNGENIYTVRGVTAEDLFSDGIITIEFNSKKTELIFEGRSIDLSRRINAPRSVIYSLDAPAASVDYLGRKRPVHYFGTTVKRKWSIVCKAPKEIEEVIGKVAYLRSSFGDSGFVIIKNISSKRGSFGDDVTINFEETDFEEGITYEI